MSELDFFSQRISAHLSVIEAISRDKHLIGQVKRSSDLMIRALQNKNRVLLCGNGGSSADAQHIAAELVGRFYLEREGLDAEALTTNTSVLTALGNDYSYDLIFSRQVESKGGPGDILLALSTSGQSKNIVQAAISAKKKSMTVISFVGGNQHCELAKYSDVLLCAPSSDTPRIQEAHILLAHTLCEYVELHLFPISSGPAKTKASNDLNL